MTPITFGRYVYMTSARAYPIAKEKLLENLLKDGAAKGLKPVGEPKRYFRREWYYEQEGFEGNRIDTHHLPGMGGKRVLMLGFKWDFDV